MALLDGMLQKIWDSIRYHGGDVVSHWLFPAIVGYTAYTVGGVYFMLKDIGPWKSHATRINKDSWPQAREIFRVAGIQLGVYAILNVIFWYSIPRHVELPTAAPSFYELIRDLAISLVIGDFIVYLEHLTNHRILFLYRKIHTVHHRFRKDIIICLGCWMGASS